MKKENIYINLQGKSKEELSEIQKVLIMFNEPTYSKDFRTYYNSDSYNYLEFFDGEWLGSRTITQNKQEVTIQQLKEILQPMENKEEQLRKEIKERGYTHDNFKCLIGRKPDGIKDINKWCYNEFNDTLYSNTDGDGWNVVYKNGVLAEIKDNNSTLEQQLEKAKAEVKRIEKEIEKQNKPKNGDWVVNNYGVIWRCSEVDSRHLLTKIQDQELINKLNELIK